MDLGEVEWGNVDWIGLAQERGKWKAVVNLVLTFRFHKMLGNYRVVSQLVASRVVLSSIELVSYIVLESIMTVKNGFQNTVCL
jgi:hypothetical protein